MQYLKTPLLSFSWTQKPEPTFFGKPGFFPPNFIISYFYSIFLCYTSAALISTCKQELFFKYSINILTH